LVLHELNKDGAINHDLVAGLQTVGNVILVADPRKMVVLRTMSQSSSSLARCSTSLAEASGN
jgi:hypothetical protein